MIVANIGVVILAVILGLRQSSHKKTLSKNPNDRQALIKLFDACDVPSSYEEAARFGVSFLENNPEDFEIMNLTAWAFSKNKAGYGIKELLENRIKLLENMVDKPQKFVDYTKKDKNFKQYAKNLFIHYASSLLAFKENELSKYYEQKSNSI
jgi:hypothetical protein